MTQEAYCKRLQYDRRMKRVLVCLHGWGGDRSSFTELRAALKGSDLEVLTPDLPGFGTQAEPKHPWFVDDYADWVERWILEHTATTDRIFLLGHSHGGRISLKLAARETRKVKLERLFLCAPAGIRHPRHIRRMFGLTLAKSGKFFLSIPGMKSLQPIGKKLLYKLVRVHDYENLTPVMRQTMINVSAEDLRPLLKDVSLPVDLFWGKDDTMTPFSDALIMEKELPNATLHAFPGVRHRVHRERAAEIAQVIKKRLNV